MELAVTLTFGVALGALWIRIAYLQRKLTSLDRTVRLMKALNQRSVHHPH